MTCSACHRMFLRLFLFSSLMVLCLYILFITYNTDTKYPNLGINTERGRQFCPKFLCAERAENQDSNPNSSTALHTEPDTILLIWMWPFGYKYDLSCSDFNITRCHLTDDKALFHKAHGVLFHHRDIHGDTSNLPTVPRPFFQKWVWLNMESPANLGRIPQLDDVFNLTCNYRLDSSIPVPYGYLLPVKSEDRSFKLPAKDKLVCWIVSNWNLRHWRVQFYNKLKDHIKIDAYGKAFGQPISDQDYWKTVSSCKFYLSFENSVYKDYITEKLYRPMMRGSVPIVLGPPRQNYEDHIPADSFIHVDDFSTPKELAEWLLYLDQNPSEYMRYFDWRSRFEVKLSQFGWEHACKTCKYLQNHREHQAFHGLNKWYWG